MYTATVANRQQTGHNGPAETVVDNERVLGIYGIVLGLIPAMGVLVFWSMGAILLLTGNGGYVNELQLTGAWRFLFFSYPAVLVVSLLLALGAFFLNRFKEAAGLAMLPVIGVVLYYFALVQLR